MALRHLGFVDLPAHAKAGGFDHAAVHEPTGRIYVAHTANDAVDVIDIGAQRYVASLPGLTGVAGALVAEPDLVFTSNRGENTVGIFRTADVPDVVFSTLPSRTSTWPSAIPASSRYSTRRGGGATRR